MSAGSLAARRLVPAVVLLSAVLQISIAFVPDTMGDLISYRDWSRALVREGFVQGYLDSDELRSRGTQIIYPPVIPILYWATGHALAAFNADLFFHNDHFLDFFLKFISVVFNVLMLVFIWKQYQKEDDGSLALAAIAAYAFNPGLIFNTSYWGQTDSISSFLIVGSLFVLNHSNKSEISAGMAALAVMAKPTVWPLALLVGIAILKRHGIRHFATSAFTAIGVILAVLSPFLFASRFSNAVRALFVQIDASPYVSANAHNLWWIIQGGLPMIHVDSKLIGPISYKLCGIIVSITFIAITLSKFWRSESRHALYLSAASLAFGFYILSTHMHENHLFGFFPILAMFAFRQFRFKRFYYFLSAVFLLNLLLHDPYLNHMVRESIPGPKLALQSPPPADSPIAKTFEREGKSYVLLERSGSISLLGFFLTFVNAVVALSLFVVWLMTFYRSKNFDEPERQESAAQLPIRRLFAVIGGIVAVTIFQFLSKVMRFL